MSGADGEDIVARYVQTFYEWRAAYGLMDECMEELRAAALVESDNPELTARQRTDLLALAGRIEEQRRSVLDCAA
jgi:hypothetical protein